MSTHEGAVLEPVAQTEEVFTSLLPRARQQKQDRELLSTPMVATLVEFDSLDRPVIRSKALLGSERVVARATVPCRRSHLGASVVVLFENGDPRLPIIVGVIEQARDVAREEVPANRTVIQADGERYVVDAEREIVLRCGESSITLTRAGKVLIKGKYILSRSSGYNKIKGAAVDIN